MEKHYHFSLIQTERQLTLLFNYYPFFLLCLLSNPEVHQTTGHLSFFFKTGSLVFETGLGLQVYITTTGLHGVGDQT